MKTRTERKPRIRFTQVKQLSSNKGTTAQNYHREKTETSQTDRPNKGVNTSPNWHQVWAWVEPRRAEQEELCYDKK